MKIYATRKKLDLDRIDRMKQTQPPVGYKSDACFITPDGYYLDLRKLGYSSHFHFYVDIFNLQNKIRDGWDEMSHPDEYDNYFVEKYGWIRLRTGYYIMITLPKSVTSNQWSALESWLKLVEQQYKNKVLSISIVDDKIHTTDDIGFGVQFFTEDVINICKRYYSSGKLYNLR